MQTTRVRVLVVSVVFVMASVVGWAQKGDLTHEHPATPSANVDFGVLPAPGPLGPLPCLQPTTPPAPPAVFGGPGDPCAFWLHHLTPEEVTILKGGEVTFQVHGGGHAMAIYEVSKDTTRNEIGQYMCVGRDPSTFTDTTLHHCLATSAAGQQNVLDNHNILDGHGDVVIVSGVGGPPAVHPGNRVWSTEGRLMSAGGMQFLNGGTIPAGPNSNGELLTYQFLKTGRYLVICMNRSHLLNDWMFGFVNVTGE